MTVEEANPATMEPRAFARLVKRTPAEDLVRLMRGERRGTILSQLVSQMPSVFRADRARGLDAVIHWCIGGRPDGGTDTYEMVIANGTCAVSPAPGREARLTLTLDAVDFLRLVTGNAHAVVLVMKGRLKTSGDIALTAKFPSLFDPPKP